MINVVVNNKVLKTHTYHIYSETFKSYKSIKYKQLTLTIGRNKCIKILYILITNNSSKKDLNIFCNKIIKNPYKKNKHIQLIYDNGTVNTSKINIYSKYCNTIITLFINYNITNTFIYKYLDIYNNTLTKDDTSLDKYL